MSSMTFAISMFLKPFVLFAFLASLLCVRYAVMKWFPKCWLKDLLLTKV